MSQTFNSCQKHLIQGCTAFKELFSPHKVKISPTVDNAGAGMTSQNYAVFLLQLATVGCMCRARII